MRLSPLIIGAALLLPGTIALGAAGGSLLHPSRAVHSAHVPPVGSAERRGIADAMRQKLGRTSGKYVVFNISHLKASGNWAWCIARPQSPSGGTSYETVGALLHKTNGRWHVSHIDDGDRVTTNAVVLRDRYPNVPGSIFVFE